MTELRHGHEANSLITRVMLPWTNANGSLGGLSGDFDIFQLIPYTPMEDNDVEPLESEDLEDGIASPGAFEIPDEFDVSAIVPPIPPMESDPLGLFDGPPLVTPRQNAPEPMPGFVPQPVDEDHFPNLVNEGYTTNLPDEQARSQAILSRMGALKANQDELTTPVNYTSIEVFRARALARGDNQQAMPVLPIASLQPEDPVSTAEPSPPAKRGRGRPRKRPSSLRKTVDTQGGGHGAREKKRVRFDL